MRLIREETLKVSKDIRSIQNVRHLKLFEIIHNMVRTGIKKTKREIFYSSPKLFGRQEIVNRMIDRFLKQKNLSMIDLNVCASLKGLFYGEVEFVEKTRKYKLNKDLIPDMNDIIEVNCIFEHVIVIEKDSMMSFIKEVFRKYEKRSNFLLITGKGYPDHNTTNFLQKLEKNGSKIYGLFDLDPHGLNIFKIYRRRVASIRRIGITSSDVLKYRVKKEDLILMTDRDFKLLKSLKHEKNLGDSFQEDVLFLEGLRRKMEIEIFTSQKTDFILEYLESQIE